MAKTLAELEKEKQRINAAYWAAESRARDKENAALVGKTFRYLNSYGSGDQWWLYAKVVGAGRGFITLTKFQLTANGEFQIEPAHIAMRLTPGYAEIKPHIFASEWRKFKRKIDAISAPNNEKASAE